jgi:gamma-glutamyltranspeptidase/glutathione hydrolase
MNSHPALVSLVLLAILVCGAGGQENSGRPRRVPLVGRSKIATKFGIVAASQPLAARAGVQVLEHGGNAVDAAIATNAVMALVEPY